MALLLVAWMHGCIGLHFWLRLRPWYPRVVAVLYGAALLLPMLALLGFARAGQQVTVLARDPDWVRGVSPHTVTPIESRYLDRVRGIILGMFGTSVGLVLLARGRPPRVRAALDGDPYQLSYRSHSDRAGGVHRPRSQSVCRHSARLGMRRARVVFDMSRSGGLGG